MARLKEDMHPKLTSDILKLLNSVNIQTVFDFMDQDNDRLQRFSTLSFQEIKEFKEEILAKFGGRIRSGKELFSIEENNFVSTGISSLDKLLNGGLHPGELYEFCGLSSAGKTQLCIILSINITLKTHGFVHYIDTKGDFSASRVHAILEAMDLDDEETVRIMNQIRITQVTNIYELLTVLYHLTKSLKSSETKTPTKLIIIDSLPSILLASSTNHKTLYFLNHVANVSKYLANEIRVPLIFVNLITQWRDIEGFAAKIMENPVTVKPMLGKFWIHVPNSRLLIEKLENEDRKISVWKSLDLEVGANCCITINDAGVS